MLHIKQLGKALETLTVHARTRWQQHQEAAQRVRLLLRQAPSAGVLRERIRQAGPDWDGAIPLGDDAPGTVLSAEAVPPFGTVVLGVDGSQIMPDRHAPVPYYVLQVGSLLFRYDGSPPQADGEAELHYEAHELYDEHDWLISPQKIGLQRLVLELEYLARKVADARAVYPEVPVVYALSDGPLVWPGRGEDALLERYLAALAQIQTAGGVPVGYVERPSGAPLLKLLGLSSGAGEPAGDAVAITLPPDLHDVDVLASHLPPGARTPWFKRCTATTRAHEMQGQAIAFCYFNAGSRYPVIARVELPVWALEHTPTLFGVLRHQTALLDGYPYVLMRAHEQAVITSEDKASLDQALYAYLWQQRLELRPTEKARHKATLARRTW